jgi:hypothetical protein
MVWTPKFTLDLQIASKPAFDKVLEDFAAWRATRQKEPKLDLHNGWHSVNPETAENMLLRNNGNRKPTLPTVKYYARQMRENIWKKTGQPILFDTEGKLLDAGHRLWASYLGKVSFDTYIVSDVPADESLFAYIDNGKVRTIADALSTAGLNGLSKQFGQVIGMAMKFERGCFTTSGTKPMPRITPIEVLHYAQENENLRTAVRLMAGEHKSATTVMVWKDVAGFMAYQILELFGEEMLDEFMSELGRVGDDEHEETSPIAVLQKIIEDDSHSASPMAKHQILGYAIKAFNAYIMGEQVKKLTLKVNEAFPRFVKPQSRLQAAE